MMIMGGVLCELKKHQDEAERIKKDYPWTLTSQHGSGWIYKGLRHGAILESDPNFVWHGKESCDPNKL